MIYPYVKNVRLQSNDGGQHHGRHDESEGYQNGSFVSGLAKNVIGQEDHETRTHDQEENREGLHPVLSIGGCFAHGHASIQDPNKEQNPGQNFCYETTILHDAFGRVSCDLHSE